MRPKYLALLITAVVAMPLAAQKSKFDIATFTPPTGWQRADTNGILMFHDYRTRNNLTSFCQLFIFPSRESSLDHTRNFTDEWNTRVAQPTQSSARPTTAIEKTPDGWTAVTGMANITQQGITYTCILVSISGFNKVMSVLVNIAGQEHMQEVEKFLGSFELDSKATAKTSSLASNNTGTFNWNDYSYIAPEGWVTQKTKDYIMLSQVQGNEGCVIQVLAPQPSSGNLETDARSIFGQMYPGWGYRHTGERHHDIAKGYTPQGLEYCIMDAAMSKMRPDGYYYDYEDGSVLVIRMGQQIAIIAGRHNRLKECFCYHRYDHWRRFFNSFTIKNQTPPKVTEDVSKRIIGSWMTIGSGALSEYIFAANGNYQFIGAYGSTSRVSGSNYHDYIEIKSSAWAGDGKYVIKGNQITFTKYGRAPETVRYRFEKVNHGDKGWKERLYLLQTGPDGKEFEPHYEKGDR
jgi:hypothetical protein